MASPERWAATLRMRVGDPTPVGYTGREVVRNAVAEALLANALQVWPMGHVAAFDSEAALRDLADSIEARLPHLRRFADLIGPGWCGLVEAHGPHQIEESIACPGVPERLP